MSFLRLIPILFACSGCFGFGSTVVGEGPPDEAAEERNVESTLAAMSSDGPLLECTFESGSWPGLTAGARITLTRYGSRLSIDGQLLPLERVDKSTPSSGYFSYVLHGPGDESIVVHGILSSRGAVPNGIYWYGASNRGATCREGRTHDGGVLDDAQLDALVTATNGRR